MSSSFSQCLDSINRSSNSIKSLYFAPSGMFTNALTYKPDITRLIRDAQDFESNIYMIDEKNNARRSDGTKGYVDLVEDNDYVINEDSGEQMMEDDRPIVKISNMKLNELNSEMDVSNGNSNNGINSEEKKLQSILNNLNSNNYTMDELINTLELLISKYSNTLELNNNELNSKLNGYLTAMGSLNQEISELKQLENDQRSQIELLNAKINNKDLIQFDAQKNKNNETKKKIYVKDLIKDEEEEIKKLEEKLNQKKKENKEEFSRALQS
ncbi:hypothetical protein PACTADRAFT_1805 [Pachysolen tannophilus NRRL Y-2460]|uniref:DASH complex subunit SPC34 n=1 Tax=Pachysolen tannophilus NRRL Y-2460 TaxID=669874 RepID=A0A1E4TZQ0_PACTA|nr:hypothetical protein PACTADRAFT_1805 [Pachysolen tannophilus NRRL Y-2460]